MVTGSSYAEAHLDSLPRTLGDQHSRGERAVVGPEVEAGALRAADGQQPSVVRIEVTAGEE
jgi:hypothetical protein